MISSRLFQRNLAATFTSSAINTPSLKGGKRLHHFFSRHTSLVHVQVFYHIHQVLPCFCKCIVSTCKHQEVAISCNLTMLRMLQDFGTKWQELNTKCTVTKGTSNYAENACMHTHTYYVNSHTHSYGDHAPPVAPLSSH